MNKKRKLLPQLHGWTLTGMAALLLGTQALAPAVTLASPSNTTPATVQTQATSSSSDQIYNTYLSIVQTPDRLSASWAYLKGNISKVSSYQASLMVLQLENALLRNQTKLEQRFFPDSVQKAISDVYRLGDSFGNVRAKVKDAKVKALLDQASAQGYKLETAEGMFYPVINYSLFRQFDSHVGEDVRAYLAIMHEESKQAAVKDAALVIGYQQLVRRTLAMEQFVQKYPNSNRAKQVRERFELYRDFTFMGTNNTPLFDYETKQMQNNAKTGYANVLQWLSVEESSYLKSLAQFMELAQKHQYKDSDEIRQFVRNLK
ncbi:hypothetical protein PA598K_03497 [Paenibacillus sp. 598K]|uniref:hypothetical protein n=1 Tax=Paenibacillus sp. 598K TaxID=1117987 RepID=UPI000FF92F87|nr:hypothetical protein [Paenibacillus sp. 598K]GBF75113.1 hypothetical protein PA598K_03497 [Paenibacillus sp. 598K]